MLWGCREPSTCLDTPICLETSLCVQHPHISECSLVCLYVPGGICMCYGGYTPYVGGLGVSAHLSGFWCLSVHPLDVLMLHLCVAKAYMSPCSLQGAAASAALVTGVSLVSIQQMSDWAKVSTLATLYFPLTLLLCISTRTLYSMLCWASVSRSSLGKCQTLTYIQPCVCWAVRP